MHGLVELRRWIAVVAVLTVVTAWSSAFACPRADACPDAAKEARHSCCGASQESQAPEARHECPGDCCRPAPDLPTESAALPAPELSAEACLVPTVLAVPVRETARSARPEADPPGSPPVPAFLLGSALLI